MPAYVALLCSLGQTRMSCPISLPHPCSIYPSSKSLLHRPTEGPKVDSFLNNFAFDCLSTKYYSNLQTFDEQRPKLHAQTKNTSVMRPTNIKKFN